MTLTRLTSDRCNFEGELTVPEILAMAKDADLQTLQTSTPASSRTWDLLNENLFSIRPDVELRVFGFYDNDCDLAFLLQVRNVRHFAADCLMQAKGVQFLRELPNLESLSIGIFDLQNFDFLADLPRERIQKLSLGATQSKRPSLALLEGFKNLKVLEIDGHQKEIETIASLANLEDLTLRSVSPAGLKFLRGLDRLWSLDIKLGGIRELSALEGLNQIKYLELWQIKGLSDIGVISTMLGLQSLFLQALRNVVTLPDLSLLTALRRVYLGNMKGVNDLRPITTAPALQEFMHAAAHNMEPADYEEVLKIKALKEAGVGLGSDIKNAVFREMAASRGIREYRFNIFSFV